MYFDQLISCLAKTKDRNKNHPPLSLRLIIFLIPPTKQKMKTLNQHLCSFHSGLPALKDHFLGTHLPASADMLKKPASELWHPWACPTGGTLGQETAKASAQRTDPAQLRWLAPAPDCQHRCEMSHSHKTQKWVFHKMKKIMSKN